MAVACPHCTKPTSPKAAQCVHCGKAVRQSAARSPHDRIDCPRCKRPAQVVALGTVEVDLCQGCHGLWLDAGEMALLHRVARDEDVGAAMLGLLQSLRASSAAQPPGYLACPVCGKLMNRKNYKQSSGVMLDRCKDHGTWLDHDDAVAVISLIVEGGDLELERKNAERQSRELGQKLRDLKSEQLRLQSQVGRQRVYGRLHLVMDIFDFL